MQKPTRDWILEHQDIFFGKDRRVLVKSIKKYGFISIQDFYNHMHPDTGYCLQCGASMRDKTDGYSFKSYQKGYSKFCSKRCAMLHAKKFADEANRGPRKRGSKRDTDFKLTREWIIQNWGKIFTIQTRNSKTFKEFNPRTLFDYDIKGRDVYDLLYPLSGYCFYCATDLRQFKSSFKGLERGYVKYCPKCSKTIIANQKRKKTCLQKYGTEHAIQSKEISQKRANTNQKKYGGASPFSSKEVRERAQQTNLKRYGVPVAAMSPEIQNKCKKTNLERYGAESLMQLKWFQDRIKEINKNKYGTPYTMQVPEVKEKARKTFLERYGVSNPFQSPKILEQIKQTIVKRYGVENPMQSKEIQERARQTNLERYSVEYPVLTAAARENSKQAVKKRYGVEFPLQSKIVQDKVKKTHLKKYGVEFPLQSKQVHAQIKKTMKERYGVENPMQAPEFRIKMSKLMLSPEMQERIKQTNLNRYGVENPMQAPEFRTKMSKLMLSPEMQERIKQTNLERYGVPYYTQTPEFRAKMSEFMLSPETRALFQSTQIREKHKRSIRSHFAEKRGTNPEDYKILDDPDALRETTPYEIAMNTNIALSSIYLAYRRHGIEWDNKRQSSYLERDMANFLDSLNVTYIQNHHVPGAPSNILPDFQIPDHKLVIEMNGDWWHSINAGTPRQYHLTRKKAFHDAGYVSFFIHEFEWLDPVKRAIWESKIRTRLNIIGQRIYARQTKISEVSHNEYTDFMEQYHLDGSAPASTRLALIHNGIPVAMMSFGKSRFKKDEYELIRYAVQHDTVIIGGFSKLLKHFARSNPNVKSIISFHNNYYSDGDVYTKNGFKHVNTDLGYFYVKDGIKYHRFNFQKHKLAERFNLSKDYVSQHTEEEIMLEQGYLKIYDAGQTKWELEIQ